MNATPVFRLAVAAALLFSSTACVTVGPQSDCSKMCNVLMRDCAYEAYPTTDSCMQGCTYDEDNGADIPGHLGCLEEATAEGVCDTFAVIECANAYGPTEDGGTDDASE